MLSLGQRLRDRYRLDALPDPESGLNVYRGFDLTESRLCAIKEIEGELAARLEREAEALTLHRHPNLPIAYDAFLVDSHLYIIFEWPEGESLQARLKREGRLPEADAVRFVTQILSALDYVHTLNLPIARTGFSPAHIWIAPDGRSRLYAGIVAITNAAPFVAPEGGSDPRADIYSAGATLYNLVTGRPPEGATSPRKFNPNLSPGIAQAIQRSLSPRPDARFANIRDMRKALGRAKTTEAPPPRKIPVIPIVISALVIALIIIAGLFLLRSPVATIAARDTETPTLQPTLPSSATVPPDTARPTQTSTAAASETPSPAPTFTPVPPTPNLTPQAGATRIAQPDKMILLYVPAGDFLMGSLNTDPQAFGNEKPQHTVFVESFWIDQTEVSNAQYQACLAADACTSPSGVDSSTRTGYFSDPQYANYPMIWVNWRQAAAYCAWAGRRLPSEAEWEKAARGSDGRAYPGGDQPPDNTLLNYNSAARDTTAVGSFPSGASPYGVFDMAGNVVEWVDGYYYDSYFTLISNTVTPTPSFFGGVRSLRSSAWDDLFENIRVASRRFSKAETSAFNNVGFRCAGD